VLERQSSITCLAEKKILRGKTLILSMRGFRAVPPSGGKTITFPVKKLGKDRNVPAITKMFGV